jgi:hypothetical protein
VAKWKHLIDIRFFVGDPTGSELPDTIYLDCPDDYWSLPLKTWTMVNWARGAGYTNVFKCDDDSYVHIPRLLASGWEKVDYSGQQAFGHALTGTSLVSNPKWPSFIFAQGGAGYWLSSRSMDVVANEPRAYWIQDRKKCPYIGCEDMAVGLLLKGKGIPLKSDLRYLHRGAGGMMINGTLFPGVLINPNNNFITTHRVQPAQQHEIHALFANE